MVLAPLALLYSFRCCPSSTGNACRSARLKDLIFTFCAATRSWLLRLLLLRSQFNGKESLPCHTENSWQQRIAFVAWRCNLFWCGKMTADEGSGFFQSKYLKLSLSIIGVLSTLIVYGVLQEKIMKSPYGEEKEHLKYSLIIVLCNRTFTCIAAAIFMLVKRKDIAPVAPMYKYGAVSVSNVLATTCQYEALKHVSFPVQTLGKCAKMLPVMMWGTLITRKNYGKRDYALAALVTVGCTSFFLNSASAPRLSERESNVWGIILMGGYLGFDGFTSTFQDKLFKGYNMDIFNQILYTTLCSGVMSFIGLLGQGQLFVAVSFVRRHPECLHDILLLSFAATASQFFISYTIRNFGALFFATLMTTRQLLSIILSCLLFAHPLTIRQWLSAGSVFGALYYKSYMSSFKIIDNVQPVPSPPKDVQGGQEAVYSRLGQEDPEKQHGSSDKHSV